MRDIGKFLKSTEGISDTGEGNPRRDVDRAAGSAGPRSCGFVTVSGSAIFTPSSRSIDPISYGQPD